MASSPINRCSIEQSLKISTLNVRGFKNKKKRTTLIRTFKDDHSDIIALQETHHLSDSERDELKLQWGGTVHYSWESNRSKGLVTLFNKKFAEEDISLVFKSDRVLISSIMINKDKLFVINIYSPCISKEKIPFLDSLLGIIVNSIGDDNWGNIICLGDFNIALNDLDVVSGGAHSDDIRQSFHKFIASLNLVDSWRCLHPQEKTFTWSRITPPSMRRLDYVLVGENLAQSICSSEITSMGFSDHRQVSTALEFSPFKHKSGLYKMNTSLLYDKDYCKMIIEQIQETEKEYASVNPHLRWEVIKTNIRETSQQFSRYKAREKINDLDKMKSRLKNLENAIVNSPNDKTLLNKIAVVKSDIEILELEKSRGAQIRSRIKYIEEGERCTKYFLSLEKCRSQVNTIKKLYSPDGSPLTDGDSIVDEIRTHFEGVL